MAQPLRRQCTLWSCQHSASKARFHDKPLLSPRSNNFPCSASSSLDLPASRYIWPLLDFGCIPGTTLGWHSSTGNSAQWISPLAFTGDMRAVDSASNLNWTPEMANPTEQFPSISNPGLANDKECNLPWEDFVEKHPEADVDLPILVCLLLTLVFDTLLVAIILLHEELRKRVKITFEWNLQKMILLHSEEQPFHGVHLCQWHGIRSVLNPALSTRYIKVSKIFKLVILLLMPGFNRGRYIDLVNESYLTCQASQTLGTFLITAPWYNFLGKMASS